MSNQEDKYRLTVSSTRQSYLTVLSNISQIKARKQAIISAKSSLRATMAGYEAGTRTMVEILQEQANLYKRQKDYAVSEYTYLTQFLTLKQLTGILDISDLEQINSWLENYQKTQKNDGTTKNKNKLTKKQVNTATKKQVQSNNTTIPIINNPVKKPAVPSS